MCLGKFVGEPRGHQDAASGFEEMEGGGTPVSGPYIVAWALIPPTQESRQGSGMTPLSGPRLGKGVGGRWALLKEKLGAEQTGPLWAGKEKGQFLEEENEAHWELCVVRE